MAKFYPSDRDGMIRHYSILNYPGLVHGFSTRKGGFSKIPYDSLNMGLNCGDNRETVLRNRELFFSALAIDPKQVAYPAQVHSGHVAVADKPGLYKQTDALICNIPGLFITIQTADCFPVFLFDPAQGVWAIIHSGWRGTSKGISTASVERMKEQFNCKTETIIAVIGAGIQTNQYQVDEQTAANFDPVYLINDGPGHYLLDIQSCIYNQLLDAGLLNKNIERDTSCTFLQKKTFYSYRRDGRNSGRMMGVIGLR